MKIRVSSPVGAVLWVGILLASPWQTSQAQETIVNRQAPEAVLTLTVTPRGFSSPRVEVPAGRLLLGVRNRAGLDRFDFVLERASGPALRNVRIDSNLPRFRDVIALTPGEYVVRVIDHPDWVCRISVKESQTREP